MEIKQGVILANLIKKRNLVEQGCFQSNVNMAGQMLFHYRGKEDDMDSGLYSTYTGLRARADMLEVLANNLANASTTAYKSDESFLRVFNRAINESSQEPLDRAINDSAVVQGSVVNFTPGPLKVTNNELDLSLEGAGFLAVETPAGTRYTRNGNLHISGKGQLITSDGYQVLGSKGPITLPPGKISFSKEGDIQIDGKRVDRLKLVNFKDPQSLEKMGSSLFAPRNAEAKEEAAQNCLVRQGLLELSNVNPVYQMTLMLNILRQFESLQKGMNIVMNTLNDRSINQVGRTV
jgi:flagellar basal-body rod protein FlgF